MRKRNTTAAYDFFGQEKKYEQVKKKKNETNSLTAQILKIINETPGSYAFRVNVMGVYNKALGKFIHSGSTLGVADVIACYRGQIIAFEIKRGSDQLSPKQLKFKERLMTAGGAFFEIRSFAHFSTIWNELNNETKI